jgi:hypothetical protein
VPVRARDLRRALESFGVTIAEPRGGGGSHWIAKRAGTVFPIPLHNGLKTEVSDLYIRGLCRAFGLVEAELRTKL